MRRVTIGLVILILISISLSTLGLQYMWSDEVYSFHAAKMIIEKGQPLYDSGLFYGRAPIYHNLLAFSIKLFGENEFGSRVLNIPFLIGASILVTVLLYKLLKTVKIGKNKKVVISFLTGIAYYISNFSIAMMRETRMYAMSTFFFLLAVFLLYKTFVKPNKKGLVHIKLLDLEFNLYYALAFLPVMYIAYDTQPINIILGLGMIIFFALKGLFRKKYRQILISVLILLAGFVLTYLKFETWDLLLVFKELSPNWANGITPFFYSILTVRNLPFVLLSAPIAIYYLFKKRDIFILFFGSIVISFLGFLSLQEAQHERYWQALVPLVIILSIYVFTLFIHDFKQRWVRIVALVLSILFLSFHIYLSIKEFIEIDTYTPHSLSIHKKLEYNKIFKYLDENITEEDILITDFHSAYTLYYKGYDIDYLVLADDNVNLSWGKEDFYFDIPLIKYSELESVMENKDGYVVVRDPENLGEIPAQKLTEFKRPEVFEF